MHDSGNTRVRSFFLEEFYIRGAFPHEFAYILASDTRVPRIYRADVIISGISLAFLPSLSLSRKKKAREIRVLVPKGQLARSSGCWWNFSLTQSARRDVIDRRRTSLRDSPRRWQSRSARFSFSKTSRAKRAAEWRFSISREIKFEQLNRSQSVALASEFIRIFPLPF